MKRHTLTIIAAALPLLAMAETDDVGMRIGAELEKSLSDKWSVGLEGEFRMNDNVSAVDRMSIGADVSCKIVQGLKASAGYDYLHSRQPQEVSSSGKYLYNTYWYPRHRFHADLTGSVKAGRLKFSLRERWQYTWRPEFERNRLNIDPTDLTGTNSYGTVTTKAKSGKGEHVLRSKLQVEYNIRRSPLTPYAFAEAYNAWSLQKMKYAAGLEYKINKQNGLKFYYMFQDKTHRSSSDDEVQDTHIIGVSYSHKF